MRICAGVTPFFLGNHPDYTPDSVRKQFTGYERDGETDLDFAEARYYSHSLGRFSSPDDFLNDTHVSLPESWNLYAYVRNNPLTLIDQFGEEVNGTGLSDQERQRLIDDWKGRTGYNNIYFDSENKLVIDHDAGIARNADGGYKGSTDFRAQLTDAVNATNKSFELTRANNSREVGFADTRLRLTVQNAATGNTVDYFQVRIDFKDFERLSGDKSAVDSFSVGIVVIHEIDHNLYGTILDYPNGLNDPGPVENNFVNPGRQQLRLPEREQYIATHASEALRRIFPDLVQVRFRIDGKDKYIRWREDQVGGPKAK